MRNSTVESAMPSTGVRRIHFCASAEYSTLPTGESASVTHSPWYVVNADNKKAARLNCIHHMLSLIPYVDLTPKPIKLAPRRKTSRYKRPPITDQTFVPEVFG